MSEGALAQSIAPRRTEATRVRPGAGLAAFLASQRWFGFKDSTIRDIAIQACIRLADGPQVPRILVLDVDVAGMRRRCQVPVVEADPDAEGLASLDTPVGTRSLRDASADPEFWRALVRFGRRQGALPSALPARSVQVYTGEQSNTVAFVDERCCVKLYRNLDSGPAAETEMLRYLNSAGYGHAPRLMGVICFGTQALAAATRILPDSEDAWSLAVRTVRQFLQEPPSGKPDSRPAATPMPELARSIGRRLAEFHRIMAEASGPRMAPVPFTEADAAQLVQEVASDLALAREHQTPETLADGGMWESGLASLHALSLPAGGLRIRVHGDLHLGQVLLSRGDVCLIDFEGEPVRRPGDTALRHPPLRDLAGLLRSLEYAALAACGPAPDDRAHRALRLSDRCQEACLAGYREAGGLRHSEWRPLLWILMLQRALHELRYERGHRPGWAHLPQRGLARLLGRGPSSFIADHST